MSNDITASVGVGGINRDPDVRTVQTLLNRHTSRLGLANLVVDGDCGRLTIGAIKSFQKNVVGFGNPDGRVDKNGRTWRSLNGTVPAGTPRLPATPTQNPAASPGHDANWPPRPTFSPLTSNDARAEVFGRFEYVHEPVAGNPENIRILGTWERDNIRTTSLDLGPNLGTRHVRFHRLAIAQLESLWRDWRDAGLLDRVRTYAGSYVPRFIRGSTRTLSNHAYGSAFDINVAWNGLGQTPAALGAPGCVRELVPIAHQHGFYWGGHFSSRPDGMHFEIARIL